jgi:hypothetical protein
MVNQSLKMAGSAALGVGIGLVVGYKVAEHRLAARFDERLENETAGMREFYTNVKQKYDTPEQAAAALITRKPKEDEDPRVKPQKIQYNKIVKGEKYAGDDGLEEFKGGCEIEEVVVTKNVFETARDPDVPYVISQEEFLANETGYEQATLTFYEIGGVLSDQRDDVIDNAEAVIGNAPGNFGEGSSDPNVVHIRNEKLQMEFEVVRSERSYQQDVLGEDPTEVRQGR